VKEEAHTYEPAAKHKETSCITYRKKTYNCSVHLCVCVWGGGGG
jgi:hypothetical protein